MNKLAAFAAAPLVTVLLSASAAAQTPADQPAGGSEVQGWSFELIPYLWAANLDAAIGMDDLPEVNVSASFGDLFENLDWAAAAYLTARHGPWVVLSDLSYLALDVEEDVGAATTVELDTTVSWVALAAGRTVYAVENRSVELFAGARYTAVNNDADASGGLVTGSSTTNEDWLDPLVGFNARVAVSDEVDLAFAADFAGFGVGSDFTYQLMPSVAWYFSQTFALHFGYRWLDTDFEDSDFKYDAAQWGWILGLGITF